MSTLKSSSHENYQNPDLRGCFQIWWSNIDHLDVNFYGHVHIILGKAHAKFQLILTLFDQVMTFSISD